MQLLKADTYSGMDIDYELNKLIFKLYNAIGKKSILFKLKIKKRYRII